MMKTVEREPLAHETAREEAVRGEAGALRLPGAAQKMLLESGISTALGALAGLSTGNVLRWAGTFMALPLYNRLVHQGFNVLGRGTGLEQPAQQVRREENVRTEAGDVIAAQSVWRYLKPGLSEGTTGALTALLVGTNPVVWGATSAAIPYIIRAVSSVVRGGQAVASRFRSPTPALAA